MIPLEESDTIDLSKGPKRSGLSDKDQLRRGIEHSEFKGAQLNAAQRNQVTKMIMDRRSAGLNSEELKKGLRELRDSGEITELQERKLRKNFGI